MIIIIIINMINKIKMFLQLPKKITFKNPIDLNRDTPVVPMIIISYLEAYYSREYIVSKLDKEGIGYAKGIEDVIKLLKYLNSKE